MLAKAGGFDAVPGATSGISRTEFSGGTADASNEQLRHRIREKAIEALNKREKLNREEWQIVSALWDRLEPKNKTPEEEKLSASDAKHIADIYDAIFAGEYCDKCGRGTKP